MHWPTAVRWSSNPARPSGNRREIWAYHELFATLGQHAWERPFVVFPHRWAKSGATGASLADRNGRCTTIELVTIKPVAQRDLTRSRLGASLHDIAAFCCSRVVAAASEPRSDESVPINEQIIWHTFFHARLTDAAGSRLHGHSPQRVRFRSSNGRCCFRK
jgi:hypothetical protein